MSHRLGLMVADPPLTMLGHHQRSQNQREEEYVPDVLMHTEEEDKGERGREREGGRQREVI